MQDYPRLEIIVSDNCSTDRTAEIVSYYPQVKLIKLPVNIGGIENANYLLNFVNGAYFVFLCAVAYGYIGFTALAKQARGG
jgi:glycosyltransferase involved in cell wall biosynthesis